MNCKSIFMVIAIAATVASGVIPTVITAVYADSENGRSDFGEQASDNLAKDGQMGEHASDPNDDGTPGNDNQHDSGDNNHRSGIGNVFNSGDPKDDPDSKHPSDTANTLCDLFPTNTACTDEP
jgi:hypothetical protein